MAVSVVSATKVVTKSSTKMRYREGRGNMYMYIYYSFGIRRGPTLFPTRKNGNDV